MTCSRLVSSQSAILVSICNDYIQKLIDAAQLYGFFVVAGMGTLGSVIL
jgi:hypothetical protein